MATIQARSEGASVSWTPHSAQNLAFSSTLLLQIGQLVIRTLPDIPYYSHHIIFSRFWYKKIQTAFKNEKLFIHKIDNLPFADNVIIIARFPESGFKIINGGRQDVGKSSGLS
jgi:hypothetical protein